MLVLLLAAHVAHGGPPSLPGAAAIASTPLNERSLPEGSTLFTSVPAARTGVNCVNTFGDPAMWSQRYTELMNGALGTGVAVADFDQDGRADLYVVSKTGMSRLFRNLGGWRFEDVTVNAGLARSEDPTRTNRPDWTQGASWADVNNDGWLDLYVCRFAAPNLLFVNQGNGTFREEAQARGLAVSDASGLGVFFDYDRDGWLDMYLHTNLLDSAQSPNGQRDHLFRNRGDGTFEDATDRAGIRDENLAHAAVVWDYDDDGWPDLYVANDFTLPDKLYRNNRDGTFADVIHAVVPSMPYSAMGADAGDINNDGLTDFLVADMAATSHEKDQRGMAYSRTLKGSGMEPGQAEAPQYSRNALYLNTGTGRCLEIAQLAGISATDWTWSPRLEDLDNDGWLDLHVTNGMIREYQNVDLLDRMVLAENLAERVGIMRSSPRLDEANLAFRNTGELAFEEIGARWGLNQHGVSFGAAYADFDGDGDLDIVVANHEASPTLLRNDSLEGNRLIVGLRGTASNRFGLGAKLTLRTRHGVQVRHLAPMRGYLSSSEPVVHFGLGSERTVESLEVAWPSGHRETFSNLEANRRYLIAEPSGAPVSSPPPPPAGPQFVEIGTSLGFDLRSEESFNVENQPLLPTRFDRLGPALAMADIDGDGDPDLALGGTGKQPTRILVRSGGRFAAVGSIPASPVDDGPLLLFDYDGDGATDLLQTKAGSNRTAGSPSFQPLLHHNEGGTFSPQPGLLPRLPISVGAATAADFDRDGRLDVFLGGRLVPGRYPLAPRSALLRNLGGRFEDVTDSLAPALREPGLVRSALWSDVDDDGWVDLLLALEWGGIRFLRNDEGRGFTDRSEAAGFAQAGNGWWTSLAAADFNGDGRLDYVAGNTGLNTLYRPPVLAYLGSFKAGGAQQLIEAYREGGIEYPRRTRKEIGGQIPAILQRFPRNDAYARAPLAELVGEAPLRSARPFTAGELRSGVFLSRADGSFRFEALPRLAQVAPFQGMFAGDLDGDGHADVVAVQNSFAPNPGVGRFSGGLGAVIRGDGRGHFEATALRESGLSVSGDAKALVVSDLDRDGWPDLLITRNNGTTQAWRNQGRAGGHALAVRLQGPSGNRTAIGARVHLELADGGIQVVEIAGGGSYYSQADAAAYFGWPAGNPPRRLVIRWPDGQTTEHPVPETSQIQIEAPTNMARP